MFLCYSSYSFLLSNVYVRHPHAWSESWFRSGRTPFVNLTKIEDSASYTLLQGAVSALNK